MGIGTTPAAFIAHGINTTIVEIDPIVYQFASTHFGLPKNHHAVIDDAISYVRVAKHAASERERFDYIIHDVFTGGAEPADLFTFEFLTDLSDMLKPDGVIAIVSYLSSTIHVFLTDADSSTRITQGTFCSRPLSWLYRLLNPPSHPAGSFAK